MGIFSMFNRNVQTGTGSVSTPSNTSTRVPASSEGLLDLKKDDILDLSKCSDTLERVHVAAGWDVVADGGKDYDLDLCAYLLDGRGSVRDTVFYGDKKAKGIFLDKDNLTGEGDGDDENIHVRLSQLSPNIVKVVFAVVIYEAKSKRQVFGKVRNAYVRLCDEDNGDKEICRYMLSEDGGDNTAVRVAELNRTAENTWEFHALGIYSKDSIPSLKKKF